MTAQPGDATDPRIIVRELAAAQRGLVRLEQALSLGLTRHRTYGLVERGELIRILPRVFALAGHPPAPHQLLLAACLWAGQCAAASHRSAALLWSLDGVSPGPVEITVRGKKESPKAGIVVRSASRPFRMQRLEGIPATSATKTVIDLASVLPETRLELALEDALRRRLTSLAKLRMAINEAKERRGIGTLRRIVEGHGETRQPTESELEARLMQVLRRAGLPPPCNQLVVDTGDGGSARLDFAYPDIFVALEVDGFRWHSGRQAWRRDRARLNRLAMLGWRVVHVTNEDLHDGGRLFVAALRSFLGQQRLT